MTPTEAEAADARRLLRAGMFPDPTPHDPPETTTMPTTAPTALSEAARNLVSDLLADGRVLLAAANAAAEAGAAEVARALEAAAALTHAGHLAAAARVLPPELIPYAAFVERESKLTLTLTIPDLEPLSCRFGLAAFARDGVPAVWLPANDGGRWGVLTWLLADGEYLPFVLFAQRLSEALALAEEAAATRVLYDAWLADRM